MSKQLVKGSAEWRAAKEQARKELDLKLSLGIPHGQKLPTIGASTPMAPKPPKPARKKAAKPESK